MIIALEGIDGAGKATALANVMTTLKGRGVEVESLSFPQYGKTASSHVISSFLNSKTTTHNPYYIAAAFALDRYESMGLLRQTRQLTICDRYTASNVAFQAARLPEAEREDFIAWLTDFEFAKLKIPAPDLIIYLEIDVGVASQLIAAKEKRSYTEEKYDAFEQDRKYQSDVAGIYKNLFEQNAFATWAKVEVTQASQLRPPEAISAEIVEIIEDAIS